MGEDISSNKVYAINGLCVTELKGLEEGLQEILEPIVTKEVQEIRNEMQSRMESVNKLLDEISSGELELAVDIGHISRKRFKKLLMSKGISRNLANKIINRFRLYNRGYTYLDVVFLEENMKLYLRCVHNVNKIR